MSRVISTKLVIEGENEYKAAIKNCNTELSTLKSELAVVTSEYRNNANSLEALNAKQSAMDKVYEAEKDQINNYQTALTAIGKKHDELGSKIIDLKAIYEGQVDTLEKLKTTTGATTEDIEKQKKVVASCASDLKIAETQYNKTGTMSDYYRQKVNDSKIELNKLDDELTQNKKYLDEAKNSTDNCATSIDQYGNKVEKSGSATDVFTDKLKNIASITAIVAVLKEAAEAVYKLTLEIQNSSAAIVRATGASGKTLEQFNDIVTNVSRKVDESDLTQIGKTVGELNTRFDATGDTLENLTYLFTEFADATETDAVTAVQDVSKVMKNWNVDLEDTESLLDKLTKAGQISGTTISALSDELVTNKAQFQELGFSLDESIALLALIEKEGFNSTAVFTGLRTAINKFSAEGKDAKTGMSELIDTIKNASSSTDALSIAYEYFGAKAGQELVYAIQSGRFEIDDFTAAIEASGGVMLDTASNADTFEDTMSQMANNVKADARDAGEAIKEAFEPTALEETTGAIEDLNTKYEQSAGKIAATAAVAQTYVDKLYDLEKQGLNTNEAQEEYKNIITRVNSLIPELNLEIDKHTGKLKNTREELEKQIVAYKDLALQQALQEKYQETYAQMVDLVAKRAETEKNLKQAEDDRQAAIAKYAVVEREVFNKTGLSIKEYAAQTEDAYRKSNVLYSYLSQGITTTGALTDEQRYLYESVVDVTAALGDAEGKAKGYSTELSDTDSAIELLNGSIDNITASMSDYMDTTSDAASSTDDMADSADNAAGKVETLADKQKELGDEIENTEKKNEELLESVDDYKDSINDTADAIKTALKNQYESWIDEAADAYKQDVANAKAASSEKIATWQKEHLEKLSLIDTAHADELNSIKSQLEEIEDAENKAELEEKLQKYQDTVNSYNDKVAESSKKLAELKAEYEKESAELEQEIAAATAEQLGNLNQKKADLLSDYQSESAEITEDGERAKADLAKYIAEEERAAKKESLTGQLNDLTEKIEAEKEAETAAYDEKVAAEQTSLDSTLTTLETEYNKTVENYKKLQSAANLNAEALKIIQTNSQDAIVKLIGDYAPDYFTAGKSVADSLLDGFTSNETAITTSVSTMLAQVEASRTALEEVEANAARIDEIQAEKIRTKIEANIAKSKENESKTATNNVTINLTTKELTPYQIAQVAKDMIAQQLQ